MLGLMLPLLIVVGAYIYDNCDCLQDSISHYYFTFGTAFFNGILWALGLVLIFYPTPPARKAKMAKADDSKLLRWIKGHLDGLLTSLSGIFAICVSVFPTNSNSSNSCALFQICHNSFRAGFHYASAALMLCIFSYMSIYIFPKTTSGKFVTGEPGPQKKKRNFVYRFCGFVTFFSVVAIGILALLEYAAIFYANPKSTYWLEVSALVPFGISWLIKGGFAITDDPKDSSVGKVMGMIKGKPKP